MYLRSQIVIPAAIYLLLTLNIVRVYTSKDNIKILLNYFNDKPNSNQMNCSEDKTCEKTNLSERNVFTKQKNLEILKNLFGEENSEVQLDKSIKAKKLQSVDQNAKNITLETTTVINDFTEISTNTASDMTITRTMETTTETINDNVSADLRPLTAYADAEMHIGQSIELLRSNAESDGEIINEAGVAILKNVSLICGYLLGKRISFANETTLMEFPWTALLLYNTKDIYHCGGSLITTKYVLTAAHCVAQEFYELTGVRLGEHDVTKEQDCAPDIAGAEICSTTIDAKIVKIIIHHGYSHLSFKNDIALLKLEQEYFSRSFYPICIPTPENTYTNTKAIVAGWGATEKAIRSSVLRKAEVPILDMSNCRSIYRYSKFNDTTEICGSGVNEVDVCQGDSGGAIFYQKHVKNKDKHFQLGIVSLGVRRCGDKRFLPAVFTNLKGFYKWIENNLEY